MPTGSVQTIVVCVQSSNNTVLAQAPCPSGNTLTTVNGYVLDVSQQASYEASIAPFDYAFAAGVWAFSFSFVLALFLVSKSFGTVLATIRR